MNLPSPKTLSNTSTTKAIEPVPVRDIVFDIEKSKGAIVKTQDIDGNLRDLSDKEKAELERYKNDTDLKTTMSSFVVKFTYIWSGCIIIIIFLTGLEILKLSDAVLIALCTQTLVTVLGLPGIIMFHFFPRK